MGMLTQTGDKPSLLFLCAQSIKGRRFALQDRKDEYLLLPDIDIEESSSTHGYNLFRKPLVECSPLNVESYSG